jgi:NDP-sugar pyrophosphorylase family protein
VKAVILAAGKGTRMRGLCEERPKPLMPLANRPTLQLILERLRDAGVTEILLVVGHQLDKIEQMVGGGSGLGVSISYAVQTKLNGTGGATLLAEGFAGSDPFLLVFGDVIAHSENYARAVELFERGAPGVLSTFDVGRRVEVGAVFTRDDVLERIVERPGPDEVSPLVSAGIFVFPPRIFDATRDLPPAPTGEHELTSGIQKLADGGCAIRTMPITGFWANLTDPDALLAASGQVQRELAEQGEQLIDASARVSPKATVNRNTALGRNTCVGESVLGGNVSIGQGSVVGSGCMLESCIVLENTCIGDGALIENAILDSKTTVPPGAMLRSPPGHASIIWKTMYRSAQE